MGAAHLARRHGNAAFAAGNRRFPFHAQGLRIVKFKIDADWWDAFFKMLSIVLVPLTVAGMGWYWTRWQQNVNDLKSMIDLVTDKSPEKQKYGIAMFEYLAKNGKVPMEFLSAQIDYATTAENHELLPMLEVAIQAAAKENSDVAEAYRVALERRPARVFIHVPNDDSTPASCACAGIRDADKASIIFPGAFRVMPLEPGAGSSAEDKPRAGQIVGYSARRAADRREDISATEGADQHPTATSLVHRQPDAAHLPAGGERIAAARIWCRNQLSLTAMLEGFKT
jgi:hypothetical protein